MSQLVAPPAPDDYASQILGPALVGYCLLVYVFGCSVPSLLWHGLHPKAGHGRALRGAVLSIFVLNAVVVGLAIHNIVSLGTLQQRDVHTLATPSAASGPAAMLVGIQVMIVQAYFAQRAYKAYNYSILVVFVTVPLMLAGLVAAIMRSVYTILLHQGHEVADQRAFVGLSWLFVTAAADAMISGMLTFALTRNKTGYNTPTDGILKKLIRAACQTAALTCVAAIFVAVLSLALQSTTMKNFYLVLLHPMPSIYSISFVWCLDSLDSLRQHTAWQRNVFMVTGSGIDASHICEACRQWVPSGSAKNIQSGLNKLQTPPLSSAFSEVDKHFDLCDKSSCSEECTDSAHLQKSAHQLLDVQCATKTFVPTSLSSRGSETEAYIRPNLRRTSVSQSSLTTAQ